MTQQEQQQKVDNFFKGIIKRKNKELAQLIVDFAEKQPHTAAETIGKETVLLAIDILESGLMSKCETAKGMESKLIKDELIKLSVLKQII